MTSIRQSEAGWNVNALYSESLKTSLDLIKNKSFNYDSLYLFATETYYPHITYSLLRWCFSVEFSRKGGNEINDVDSQSRRSQFLKSITWKLLRSWIFLFMTVINRFIKLLRGGDDDDYYLKVSKLIWNYKITPTVFLPLPTHSTQSTIIIFF